MNTFGVWTIVDCGCLQNKNKRIFTVKVNIVQMLLLGIKISVLTSFRIENREIIEDVKKYYIFDILKIKKNCFLSEFISLTFNT